MPAAQAEGHNRATRILEMLEVTDAAALAAGRWMGKGDKMAADDAAVEGMRQAFANVDIDGTIVIGEGERDEAPMLYIGEKVGRGGEAIDIAVDPLEGTNLAAYGQSNAIAVLAFGPQGTLLHAPDTYMHKVAVGPEAYTAVHIDASPTENVRAVAKALKRDVEDLVVCILDRERHTGPHRRGSPGRRTHPAHHRRRRLRRGGHGGRGYGHTPLPRHRCGSRRRAGLRGDEVHRRLLHGPIRVAQ